MVNSESIVSAIIPLFSDPVTYCTTLLCGNVCINKYVFAHTFMHTYIHMYIHICVLGAYSKKKYCANYMRIGDPVPSTPAIRKKTI